MYVYIESERGKLWTVGFYSPDGKWHAESDHSNMTDAAVRVHWLNGGEERGQTRQKTFHAERGW